MSRRIHRSHHAARLGMLHIGSHFQILDRIRAAPTSVPPVEISFPATKERVTGIGRGRLRLGSRYSRRANLVSRRRRTRIGRLLRFLRDSLSRFLSLRSCRTFCRSLRHWSSACIPRRMLRSRRRRVFRVSLFGSFWCRNFRWVISGRSVSGLTGGRRSLPLPRPPPTRIFLLGPPPPSPKPRNQNK